MKSIASTADGAEIVKLPGRQRGPAVAPDRGGAPGRRAGAPTRGTAQSAARAGGTRQALGAAAGIAALIVTAISVPHIASGLREVTRCDGVNAYLMGVAIDGGMVVAELSMIFAAPTGSGEDVARFARFYLAATLGLSAAMNAFAFSGSDVMVERLAGIAIGGVIPLLTYCLTKMAAGQLGPKA